MAVWDSWILLAFLTPVLLLSLGVLVVAYAAYQARLARERRARVPANVGPDPLIEYERLNEEAATRMAEARRILESTRDAIRRGVR